MTSFALNLYHDLISLCHKDDSFFFKDTCLNEVKYRVFNYRVGSYTIFHSYPSALNCRGTMFDITNADDPRLVSLPPEKFFNYEEGPGGRYHQLGRFGTIMEKMDGSLISTFLHVEQNNQHTVRLKSKGSIQSTQADDSMALLAGKIKNDGTYLLIVSYLLAESDQFKAEIEALVRDNYTINMEYTSPSNRIVVYYPTNALTILSIRSHLTGETLFGDRLRNFLEEKQFTNLLNRLVRYHNLLENQTQQQIVDGIRQETEGEGYVIEIVHPDGPQYLVKVKNTKYLQIHNTKEQLNSNRHLFESIIFERSDDLKALYSTDEGALNRIESMEAQVLPVFNRMIADVERLYDENKHLSRKEFAIMINSTPRIKIYMPLLMNLYSGKVNDYRTFAIQNVDKLFKIQ